MNAVDTLDNLIKQLDAMTEANEGEGDAIDRVLAAPERTTNVRSLRDQEVMTAFRQELTDGLIRVDTARRVLDLVGRILAGFLTRQG